ncbi:MAG: hypothetical protein ACSHX6_11995 [Akkermansiaceae bacterium]
MENPYQTPDSNPHSPDIPKSPQDLDIPGLSNAVYPLFVSFKILAFAPQLQITDSAGRSLVYVKQKLFKFKEKVDIFTDKSKTTQLGTIKANKVIDWSARYFFASNDGSEIGSVGRKGMRSLWKASYETFNPGDDTPDYHISEENPMSKVFDSLIGEIPIVGMATSYLFNPKYLATQKSNGEGVMRVTKKPALWEGKFQIDKLSDALTPQQELNLIFSFIMLLLLERSRG